MPTSSARISSSGGGLGVERDRAAVADARRPSRRAPQRRRGSSHRPSDRSAAAPTGSALGAASPATCVGASACRRDAPAAPAPRARLADPVRQRAELHLAEEGRAGVSASGSRTSSASSGSSAAARRASASPASRDTRIWSAWSISISRRLGCLISPARASSAVEVAVFLDQLRGGLDADAGRAGHVVDRVADQRLHVDRPGPGRRRTSRTPRSGPIGWFFIVSSISMPGPTSCIRSLSDETIVTRPPPPRACVA